MNLIRLLVRAIYLRLRAIGHAHRYVTDEGLTTPFCVVCGQYPR